MTLLHTYDNGPLTEGWDCVYCAVPFPKGGTHVESPDHPGLYFCRPGCAESYIARESRRRTSSPEQVGFCLDT